MVAVGIVRALIAAAFWPGVALGWALSWLAHRPVPLARIPAQFDVVLDEDADTEIVLHFFEASCWAARLHVMVESWGVGGVVLDLSPGALIAEPLSACEHIELDKLRGRYIVHVRINRHRRYNRRGWCPDVTSCSNAAKLALGVRDYTVQTPVQLLWWLNARRK